MNNKSDETIIIEVLSGNTERFGVLTDKYYRLCIHYLINAMYLDSETAFDLTQETFMRAFKSLASFSTDRSFKPWLMAICRNLAIDYLKNMNRKTVNLFEFQASVDDHSDAAIDALDLKSAINRLPARQQEVVEMFYFWELKCNEISEILQIPVGTVKSELFMARNRLQEILENHV